MREMTGNEDGSVSIEAALALSSLVVVSALIIGVLTTLALYVAAVGGAGAAARAHAIGETYHPPRGSVTVEEHGGLVTATVSFPRRWGR